jgi:hypothetical protein
MPRRLPLSKALEQIGAAAVDGGVGALLASNENGAHQRRALVFTDHRPELPQRVLDGAGVRVNAISDCHFRGKSH